MRILLFNDNPVVQKLVALSAQKTKDELSMVSSAGGIKEESYDLLIIDDGLYSDETFAEIKEYAAFKSALLMATRGNPVPAGFDHVINKPFLPTDLVDTLTQVEQRISRASFPFDEKSGSEPAVTAILDQEEVKEVRGLLEDTDAEEAEEDEFYFDLPDETDEDMDDEDKPVPQRQNDVTDPFDFDALDDLEWQIQEAVDDLGPEELELELGAQLHEAFAPYGGAGADEPFDELDLLDEHELKLAIGEEAEEESAAPMAGEGSSPSVAEALGEVMGKPLQWNNEAEKSSAELKATPAEGVAVLQALLKALANEEVAKSLKGLNISININFGNGA